MTIKAVFCFISKKGYLIIKEIIIIAGISFRNLDAPEANTHQTFKRSHYWKEASEQYVLSLTAYHSSLRPPEMASDREYMYVFVYIKSCLYCCWIIHSFSDFFLCGFLFYFTF